MQDILTKQTGPIVRVSLDHTERGKAYVRN
jgi:hypothetical protein